MINSQPEERSMRQAIREAWCKDRVLQGEIIRCVFVLGVSRKETYNLTQEIELEQREYGDILQGRFVEEYNNLTLKTILVLKWITEHLPTAKYYFKLDSDVFVSFSHIIAYIKSMMILGGATRGYYLGYRKVGTVRFSPSNPKHRMYLRYLVADELYKGHYYPPYCSGGGYVLSVDRVPELYEASLTTSLINMEDAFMGVLAKKIGIYPSHHPGFLTFLFYSAGRAVQTCLLRKPTTIVVHLGMNWPEIVREIWHRYRNDNQQCSYPNVEMPELYRVQQGPVKPVKYRIEYRSSHLHK